MSIADLDREDRLRLMKFVCSFAWADLEVRDEERSFVHRMMKRLELDAEEQKLVEEWLEVPPRAEELWFRRGQEAAVTEHERPAGWGTFDERNSPTGSPRGPVSREGA